jgi:hypothetical protein
MWSSLVGLALLLAINPVLVGFILLMISRPRPVENLLAFWVGRLTVWFPGLLVPLLVLHSVPAFNSFAHDFTTPASAASSLGRHIQFAMGVLALFIATLMTARSLSRRRQVATAGGNAPTLVLDRNAPTPISPPPSAQDAVAKGGLTFRALFSRLRTAWDNGSLWVAFAIGLGGVPPPILVLLVDTAIVASGVAIGTQVCAVIVFVVGMYLVVEMTLVGYLAAPAKTQAILRPVHGWTLAHRRKIVIVICAVVGVWQVAHGLSIV